MIGNICIGAVIGSIVGAILLRALLPRPRSYQPRKPDNPPKGPPPPPPPHKLSALAVRVLNANQDAEAKGVEIPKREETERLIGKWLNGQDEQSNH